jgi:DNA-binding NtrC family response regulator
MEASDADRAEQMVKDPATRVDLLLTDVVMPGRTGPELFAALASARPNIKVLYMSGYAGEKTAEPSNIGAGRQFLQKPFTALAFMRKVRETLDQGRTP